MGDGKNKKENVSTTVGLLQCCQITYSCSYGCLINQYLKKKQEHYV